MKRKGRLTVTVDAELLAAGNRAVTEGRADSLSSWVNTALADQRAKELHLEAMAAAVAEYERRFGAITAEEIAAQRRADERAAIVVRGSRGGRTRPRRKRAA